MDFLYCCIQPPDDLGGALPEEPVAYEIADRPAEAGLGGSGKVPGPAAIRSVSGQGGNRTRDGVNGERRMSLAPRRWAFVFSVVSVSRW